MATEFALGVVKGADPERFVIVGMDLAEGQMKSTEFFTEEELREHLGAQGVSEEVIDSEIGLARSKPHV